MPSAIYLDKNYDLIVLGGGGMGSAAAYEATRMGLRVLVIDKNSPPHAFGSTHGETRLIRKAYFEDTRYVPMLQSAYQLWHEWENAAGQNLFVKNGLVLFAPADSHYLKGTLHAAALHGLPIIHHREAEAATFAPALHPPAGFEAVFEADAGFLHVETCVAAALRLAIANGAQLATHTEVTAIHPESHGVVVEHTGGRSRAKSLVIAAGPWSQRFLPLPLQVRRVPLFWFQDHGAMALATGMPCFAFHLDDGFYYGMPSVSARGVKMGRHVPLDAVNDPDHADRHIPLEEVRRASAFAKNCFHQLDAATPSHSVMCFYTMSPDEHFIVDQWPDAPHIAYVAGLSGHGFKFAPIIGRSLVALATGQALAVDISFLRAQRFALA